ncbi:MAG TPA: hypothetical protein VGM56_01120 [Byssovorax sp.]|jgi:hypothetical protein
MVDGDDGDDGPTERIEELSDEDWQTIRASLAALGPAVAGARSSIDEPGDDVELPTTRLEAMHHERTVELTVDALPPELRRTPLPFVDARPAPAQDAGEGAARADDGAAVAAIAAELERGEAALRDAHDDAFLARRAAHRGVFDLAGVASLRASAAAGAPCDPMDIADALRVRRVAARRRATT